MRSEVFHFGNIPDKLSHTGSCSVLIASTAEARASDGDMMSGVATNDAG